MYILEVIPLTTLPQNGPQILSYFSDQEMAKGSVVEIGVNNRKVKGIIVSSDPLEKEKIHLKKSLYQLRKISKVISSSPLVSENQFKIALWISRNYYSPLGLSLKSILPPFWGKKKYSHEISNGVINLRKSKPKVILSNTKNIPVTVEPILKDAVETGQALVILPDKEFIPAYFERFSRLGHVTVIKSGLRNEEYFQAWQAIRNGTTKIILGTRNALLAPFDNLTAVVLVDSQNDMYVSDMSPKYNASELAEYISGIYGAKIFFTDPIEGVTNHHRIRNGELAIENARRTDREVTAVDMTRELQSGNFWNISNALRKLILETLNADEKILIFSSRKGYMGLLVCQNCGTAVKCPNCDVPMRVHQALDLTLVCHHCVTVSKIPSHCPNCNSARLRPVGPAGSQRIFEEIYTLKKDGVISDIPIVVMDSDITKNETEENEVVETILKPGPAVCIATQRIFSYLPYLTFKAAGIINGDSLMNMPDYRSEEKFISIFEKICDFEVKKVILQVFHRDSGFLDLLPQGNYSKFYSESLDLRSQYKYPPFSKLILLSYSHQDQRRAGAAARLLGERLRMALARTRLNILLSESSPAFISKEKGRYHYHILIKVLPGEDNIREILKYVPGQWKISVNPTNLIY